MRNLARLLLFVLVASCSGDLTSNRPGAQMSLDLASLEAIGVSAQAGDGRDERFRVTRGRVRIFVRGNTTPIVDRAFNPDELGDDDDGRLTVTFPLPAGSESAVFEFLVEVFNAQNEQLYAVGPATFTMSGSTPGATVTATAEYVGPGAAVSSVRLDRSALTLAIGESATVRCIGGLGGGAETESFPKNFTSENGSVADVDGGGRITARQPGTATIRCTQEVAPNASASVQVTVTDRANGVQVENGEGQTGPAGAALPQPVRVRVVGVTGAPIEGATVRFATTGGSVNPAVATTDANGRAQTTWTLGSAVGQQSLSVAVDGITAGRNVTATATAPPPGSIQGVVRSATTGEPITVGGTVEVRSGADVVTGAVVATVQSAANTGVFTVPGLVPGTYTVSVTAQGFAPGRRTVVVTAGAPASANVVLSPNAAIGEIRVVLTWGDTPPDLDALLQVPSGSVVSWLNPGSCSVAPFACLDVDDVDGRGPETITISQTLQGTYVFAVEHYAGDAPGGATDPTLSNSGALVEVYNGNSRVAAFPVPTGRQGRQWIVFSYSAGVITPVNTFNAGQAGVRAGVQGDGRPVKKK
jgi:hypothetical protein